ncbi:MAG TPA: hypothetical protein VHG11_10475 [Pseudorhizobium sp.]|nr:hypothetical protein [Pseudorhizobium sp.]
MDNLACSVQIEMPHAYAQAFAETRFDLLLIDVDVVQTKYLETIRAVRQQGMAVVFTTLTRDAMERLGDLSGSAAVAKPFVEEELLAVVQAALPLPELDA